MPIIRFTICAALLVLLAGCGKHTVGGIAINGAVSYAGEPVQKGSITFRPADPKLKDVSAPIVDGTYRISAQLGPQAEEYVVKVVAFHMKKSPATHMPAYLKEGAANDPNAGMVLEQYIPKKYNEDSQLKVKFDAVNSTYDFQFER